MQIGQREFIQIPFENKFISQYSNNGIILNELHLNKILKTSTIKESINNGLISNVDIQNTLKTALQKGMNDEEFIEILCKYDENKITFLNQDDIKRAYLIPRKQEDTAKAIFRLISLGIIDSYTIDYQNKLFNVEFTKKEFGFYFNCLEQILSRYNSVQIAKNSIEELKNKKQESLSDGSATEISVCIEYLTDFIYDRIADKRKRAIDDMLGMCQRALAFQDNPIKQNLEIKEEIYYYFNAKYSRYRNRAIIKNDESGLQNEENASIVEDHDNGIEQRIILWKYIRMIEHDSTGSFIDNVKHLRGATMRMIRAYDNPIYIILKAYTLFILSDKTIELLDEAVKEMLYGIKKQIESDESFDIEEDIIPLINKIELKISNSTVLKTINELKDSLNLIYYANWTKKFSNKFTQNLNYD